MQLIINKIQALILYYMNTGHLNGIRLEEMILVLKSKYLSTLDGTSNLKSTNFLPSQSYMCVKCINEPVHTKHCTVFYVGNAS